MKIQLNNISKKKLLGETGKTTIAIICVYKSVEQIEQGNLNGGIVLGAIGVVLIAINYLVK